MSQSQEVDALRQALVSKLWSALAESGCSTLDDVRRTLVARGIEMHSSTVTRYLKGELPTENKIKSREELQKIASLTRLPGSIMSDWEDLVSAARMSRNAESHAFRKSNLITGTRWFQVIPVQPNRNQLSIDVVHTWEREAATDEKPIHDLIEGVCERVYPPNESDLSWYLEGFTDGGVIVLGFNPYHNHNSSSRGSINLAKSPDPHRPVYYTGRYLVRMADGAGFTDRSIEWHTSVPTKFLPDVALLDLDNTLRSGWSIVSWVTSETMRGLTGVERLRDTVLELRGRYVEHVITHDEFAVQAAEAYAEFLESNAPLEVQRAAILYVRHELSRVLFRFAKPLVLSLRDRQIAPILVTGAPRELAIEVAKELNIEEVYSLTVDKSGVVNPGTAGGKRSVVDQITADGRRVLLAAGDSDSDIPLMRLADFRIVSPHLNLLVDDDPGIPVLEFTASTTASEVLAWVESNIRQSLFEID
ncbi:haloacid dehalogenase-like hydrolase [Nocardia pseudovaccinii]|uniref:haloacid dehalogenase-like hydrolase n=1 Tax=Nocardia pseudovaccinii TaxID=189540 RepID=UPI003D8E8A3A